MTNETMNKWQIFQTELEAELHNNGFRGVGVSTAFDTHFHTTIMAKPSVAKKALAYLLDTGRFVKVGRGEHSKSGAWSAYHVRLNPAAK